MLINFHVTELPYFKQVMQVLGYSGALEELSKVMEDPRCHLTFDLEAPLDEAFYWTESPQGHEFWYNVDRGVNPYEK